MYINLFKVYFALVGFSVLICSFMINYLESLTPSLIINSFRYGKLSCGYYKSFLFRSVEIPKRWFRHFYVVAVIWSTVTLCFTLYTYAYTVPVSKWILYLLDSIGSSERKVKINATSTIVALILFNAQTWRRFYETFFISIFSDSKMNIAHYGVGIAHYIGATFALIAESPLFASESFEYRNVFTFSDVSWNVIIGIITFLWAWYHQLKVAIILADLRKDDKGNVVTYDHKMPTGDLFEFVSAPHMFCEMLMYFALYIILWGNTTWPYVLFWVCCNQCESALLNHWWYKSKFKSYPKNRKAIIPFIL